MKVLSMFCVIMGHRYSSLDALVSNKEETTEVRLTQFNSNIN